MAAVIRMLYAPLMVLSSTAAISGNLFLLLILLLNKELQSDTVCLTLSLSLCDLAIGLSIIPFGAHNSLFWPVAHPSKGVLCQGSGFVFLLLQTASIQSLTWATVDKFTEICYALSYRSIWTARRRGLVLVLIWMFCLGIASLPLLGFGSYAYSESRYLCCLEFTPKNSYFVALWTTASVVVPIVIMCSLYGCIVHIAKKQARRGRFECNELHCFYVPANNYLKCCKVMVATSVCLLVCWLPYTTVCLYETFNSQQSPSGTSAFSTWLVLTSAALNPWITCMTQIRYRAAASRSFRRFLQKSSGKRLGSSSQNSVLQQDTANQITASNTATGTRLTPLPAGSTNQ